MFNKKSLVLVLILICIGSIAFVEKSSAYTIYNSSDLATYEYTEPNFLIKPNTSISTQYNRFCLFNYENPSSFIHYTMNPLPTYAKHYDRFGNGTLFLKSCIDLNSSYSTIDRKTGSTYNWNNITYQILCSSNNFTVKRSFQNTFVICALIINVSNSIVDIVQYNSGIYHSQLAFSKVGNIPILLTISTDFSSYYISVDNSINITSTSFTSFDSEYDSQQFMRTTFYANTTIYAENYNLGIIDQANTSFTTSNIITDFSMLDIKKIVRIDQLYYLSRYNLTQNFNTFTIEDSESSIRQLNKYRNYAKQTSLKLIPNTNGVSDYKANFTYSNHTYLNSQNFEFTIIWSLNLSLYQRTKLVFSNGLNLTFYSQTLNAVVMRLEGMSTFTELTIYYKSDMNIKFICTRSYAYGKYLVYGMEIADRLYLRKYDYTSKSEITFLPELVIQSHLNTTLTQNSTHHIEFLGAQYYNNPFPEIVFADISTSTPKTYDNYFLFNFTYPTCKNNQAFYNLVIPIPEPGVFYLSTEFTVVYIKPKALNITSYRTVEQKWNYFNYAYINHVYSPYYDYYTLNGSFFQLYPYYYQLGFNFTYYTCLETNDYEPDNISFSIRFNVYSEFYIYTTDNPDSILDSIVKMIVPLILIAIFPFVFYKYTKKVIWGVIGLIGGVIVLSFSGFITIFESIILLLIAILILIYIVKRGKTGVSEND